MLLALENVSKSFGAVAAVSNLSLHIAEGEVLGIMGPNGAGKTTLLNLVMGATPLDTGSIHFAGEQINHLSVSTICHRGIGRTYQIPQPFRQMTVLENLLVGALYGGRRQTMKTARLHALEVLARVGLASRAEELADSLGLLELKRLELARALALRPRLLLLDEIAGGLVESEVEALKSILYELKCDGQAMLIIEHLLSVLFGLSDRIAVLNFGEQIAGGTPAEIIHNPLVIEAYLGKEHAHDLLPPVEQPHRSLTQEDIDARMKSSPPEPSRKQKPARPSPRPAPIASSRADLPMVSLSHVSAGYGAFQALFDVSLDIRQGEIVGLIGLNGAGKTTLIRALTRRIACKEGDILFKGKNIIKTRAHEIANLGIAQCIEGRKIFPELTVRENLELGAYCKHARAKRHETLKQVYELFPILAERHYQLGSTLSGGQQQMLAIGRALMARPELMIFDEISLGLAPIIVDVLFKAIVEINRQGMTVLLVEQSVQRCLDIAHRAYIIEHGRIVLSGATEALQNNADFRQAYFGL